MKKRIISLLSLLFFLGVSCHEQLELNKTKEQFANKDELQSLQSGNVGAVPLDALTASSCGGTFNGSYNIINSYYVYPLRTVDVSCAAAGATITVSCSALDVPNKFTILDAANNTVVASGWLGNAAYPGPWGSSLSNSGSTTLTFPKSSTSYKLRVETLTPPDHSYYPTTDAWYVSVSCTCSSPPCTTCPCVPCPTGYSCVNGSCVQNCTTPCGGYYDGSYNVINSYYTYPLRTVDVTCAANGATITVNCSALDVPNRFTILDASNNLVVASNWLGNASYPGPWGGSLSTSGNVTLTFAKSGNTYKLRVETLTPPNYSYSPSTDYWSTSISCPK